MTYHPTNDEEIIVAYLRWLEKIETDIGARVALDMAIADIEIGKHKAHYSPSDKT